MVKASRTSARKAAAAKAGPEAGGASASAVGAAGRASAPRKVAKSAPKPKGAAKARRSRSVNPNAPTPEQIKSVAAAAAAQVRAQKQRAAAAAAAVPSGPHGGQDAHGQPAHGHVGVAPHVLAGAHTAGVHGLPLPMPPIPGIGIGGMGSAHTHVPAGSAGQGAAAGTGLYGGGAAFPAWPGMSLGGPLTAAVGMPTMPVAPPVRMVQVPAQMAGLKPAGTGATKGARSASTRTPAARAKAPSKPKGRTTGSSGAQGINANGTKRRMHQRWTLEETRQLVEGVERFGLGKWAVIKTQLFEQGSPRTPVDLKDKWRNLHKALSKASATASEAMATKLEAEYSAELVQRVKDIIKPGGTGGGGAAGGGGGVGGAGGAVAGGTGGGSGRKRAPRGRATVADGVGAAIAVPAMAAGAHVHAMDGAGGAVDKPQGHAVAEDVAGGVVGDVVGGMVGGAPGGEVDGGAPVHPQSLLSAGGGGGAPPDQSNMLLMPNLSSGVMDFGDAGYF